MVKIGCSSAFWGDSISAAHQLVNKGNIDYLVADYLAEVTMGILAKSKARQKGGAGEGGFIKEFVTFVWKPLMKTIMQKNIKIVTNAGGLNPIGLKNLIEETAKEAGIQVPVVAAVFGDDLLPDLNAIQDSHIHPFRHIANVKDDEVFPTGQKIESLNAYIGAEPIAKALEQGAQIVVTGRCVDSAMVLGPLIYEFKWSMTDYDKLAAGSLAGHIIECGCQATGGNFTDWKASYKSKHGGWSNMDINDFRIVDVQSNGVFDVSKPINTGGLVTRGTVGEQMIYEISDPGSYILPDVIVDLRNVELKELANGTVRVSGAKGRAPTKQLKVSGIYMDGYKVTGEIFIGGMEARDKALAVGESILTRVKRMLKTFGMDDFKGTNIEALGSEHTYGNHAKANDTREVVLRLTVHHLDPQALRFFLLEIAPSATCMAPGIIGVSGGRPRPQGNMVHFAVLVDKSAVKPQLKVGENSIQTILFTHPSQDFVATPPLSISVPLYRVPDQFQKAQLIQICFGRSGDKGDSANIGLLCRRPEYYSYLFGYMTASKIHQYMQHLMANGGTVERYELPGCFAFNFMLTRVLGGGGLSSLQIDRQGKTYAQMVLSMDIQVPSEWSLGAPSYEVASL